MHSRKKFVIPPTWLLKKMGIQDDGAEYGGNLYEQSKIQTNMKYKMT